MFSGDIIKIAIIGAGQLGSRHLQALAATDYSIYVIDPSQESLEIAKSRFEEVNQDFIGVVNYFTSVQDLPKKINIAIVATGSNVRANVIEKLFQHASVQYVLLEKFLFPRIHEYGVVKKIFEKNGAEVWVNCVRRIYPIFQQIKSEVNGEKVNIQITVNKKWGLGCNAIHMLDLFAFLIEDSKLILNGDNLDKVIHQSKRKGYLEFTGTLTASSSKGDFFSISSFDTEDTSPVIYTITTPSKHYLIHQKGDFNVFYACSKNNWEWQNFKAEAPLQSQLTHKFVDGLLKNATSELTSFSESSELHILLLSTFIKLRNSVDHSVDLNECSIT